MITPRPWLAPTPPLATPFVLGNGRLCVSGTGKPLRFHVPDVLCDPLSDVLGDDPIAQACQVCDLSPLTGLQLPSTRQHELTRAGVLAFFNAYLRCRPLALAYLKHVYDVENSELAAMYSGGFGDGLEQCLAQ